MSLLEIVFILLLFPGLAAWRSHSGILVKISWYIDTLGILLLVVFAEAISGHLPKLVVALCFGALAVFVSGIVGGKLCSDCGARISSSAHKCSHCQAEFGQKEELKLDLQLAGVPRDSDR